MPIPLSTPVKDYDNTLTGELIRYVENPDSILFENGRWYSPQYHPNYNPKRPQWDKYNFGMGIDRNTNEYVRNGELTFHKDSKGREYLTEEEERNARNHSIASAETSYNNRLAYAQKVTGSKKVPSEMKKALTINAIYNLGSGTVSKDLFNDKKLMDAFINGTEQEYSDIINQYYRKYNKANRGPKTNEFLASHSNKLMPIIKEKPDYDFSEKPDALRVATPYPTQVEARRMAPIMVPDEGSYVKTHSLTPTEDNFNKLQRAIEAHRQYNNMMESISVQNNPVPQFIPKRNTKAEGGSTKEKSAWNKLSLAEKAEMIGVAVKNGITTLPEIRAKYNEFAGGGPTDPPVDPLVAPLDIDLNLDPIEYEMPQEEEPVMKVSAKVADEVIAIPKAFTPTDAKNDIRNFYVNDFAQRRQKYHPTETPTQVGNLFDSAPVEFSDTRSGVGGTYNSGNITVSKRLSDNSKRSTIAHEMRHLMDDQLGGLTPEESQMLHDAYNLKAGKGYQYLEDEYPTTNTELRYQISRDYNNATGEELNKIIQGLPDNNLIDRASWVNGYNQIPDNILTPKNDKQLLEQKKKADAIRKALMEVAFNPVQTPFNYAAEGGSIHIKPSKKGTFTAAASKHGKSVQEFASQVLAHPENYSPAMRKKANFARNAAKWKHADGGNLFDEESQPTQLIQIMGKQRPFWEELAEYNRKKEEETQRNITALKQYKGKELAEKRQRDYLTTSNDNTWVENSLTHRQKNPHLSDRSIEGAKAYEEWAKAHPNLATWGTALGTVPFAIASYPFVAAGSSGLATLGDASAATSAGQAITAGLAPLATAATTNVAGAPLYTWADVGLSSLFGAHGAKTAIDEGGVSPTTALELLPLAQVAKPAIKMGLQGVENVRHPLGRINEGTISKTFPTESDFNFWHGGLEPDFNFRDLDILRLGSKQAKRGRDYAGFYMYDSSNQPGAFGYGAGNAHGIKIADNAKAFNADFNTERLSVKELMNYQNQGYDIIKGKNVFGEPEYILLNKDVIENSKFFDSNPGHTINYSKRQLKRMKKRPDLRKSMTWGKAQTIVHDSYTGGAGKSIENSGKADGGNLYGSGGNRIVTTGGAGYVPPAVDASWVANKLRNRLYRTINPLTDYNIRKNLAEVVSGNTMDYGDIHKDKEGNAYVDFEDATAPVEIVDDIWAKYLSIPENQRRFTTRIEESAYRPQMGGNKNLSYYRLPLTDYEKDRLIEETDNLPIGKNKVTDLFSGYNLADHTIGRGIDARGEYRSYYDRWDINPFSGKYQGWDIPFLRNLPDTTMGIGKPVEIYDRIYLDDYYGVSEPTHATYLPEVTVFSSKHKTPFEEMMEEMGRKAEGGKIYIKPENRGKFTALKERTGHSATWFKEHGTPAQKKMATFALNARHWKHGLGGNLFE